MEHKECEESLLLKYSNFLILRKFFPSSNNNYIYVFILIIFGIDENYVQ